MRFQFTPTSMAAGKRTFSIMFWEACAATAADIADRNVNGYSPLENC